MKYLVNSLVLLASLCIGIAKADRLAPQSPSADMLKSMSLHNVSASLRYEALSAREQSDIVPFAEYETTGYLFFSDSNYRGNIAKGMKRILAENLPADVTLVIYTQSTSKSYQRDLFNTYSNYIPAERLRILEVPRSGRNDFWTRDNLPVPVWNQGQFSLVDAQYYYNFEPDAFLKELFGVSMTSHPFFFEGGNFIANAKGDCIVVNRKRSYPGGVSDTGAIPDAVFSDHYGCKNLIRLKHLKGIGHSDEVVKFMSDNVVVTDTHQYVAELESHGFEVHMLPEPDRNYETYANSLLVNDVLFVPVFSESGDKKAIEIYKNINPNWKIVEVPSRRLATRGQGGVHCITMNYPPGSLERMGHSLGGKLLSGADLAL
jgi:agmatine/peptidylarginine deiminase